MRIRAIWRKYRRKVYKVADWVLYISGGFSALLLLWIVLQVTMVAHFVVPTGSMEPTLIPGDPHFPFGEQAYGKGEMEAVLEEDRRMKISQK